MLNQISKKKKSIKMEKNFFTQDEKLIGGVC